jgi:uncharacterized protein YoxC
VLLKIGAEMDLVEKLLIALAITLLAVFAIDQHLKLEKALKSVMIKESIIKTMTVPVKRLPRGMVRK